MGHVPGRSREQRDGRASGAVMTHEGQAFVFVEQDRGTYRRLDVDVGIKTPDWVEIRQGLSAGQRVVDRGAFFLKSEHLLEGELE